MTEESTGLHNSKSEFSGTYPNICLKTEKGNKMQLATTYIGLIKCSGTARL